jgi:hypothetical protein
MKKDTLAVLGLLAFTVLMVYGYEHKVPWMMSVVFIGIALVCIPEGVKMIVTRRAEIAVSDDADTAHEHHRGLTAVFWGLLFLVIGIPSGLYGVGYWVLGGTSLDRIADRFITPSIGAIGFGLVFLLFGLPRLLGGKATFVDSGIRPVTRIVGGLSMSALGALTLMIGVMETVTPGSSTRLRDAAFSWVVALVK